jgi:hypothetical protein
VFDCLATGFLAFLFPNGRRLALAAAGTAVAPGLRPLFSAASNTAAQIIVATHLPTDVPKPLDWLIAQSDADFAEKIIRLHEDEACRGHRK